MTDEVQVLQLSDPTKVTKEDVENFGTDNLVNVVIPDEVLEISQEAFRSCKKLKRVIFPSSVTEIGDRAFYDCRNLKEITIPDGVTAIGSETFCGCRNLKEITIPDGVTEIGSGAFYGCIKLKEITLPDSLTKIDAKAFYACGNLERVTIPDGVTAIGSWSFNDCKNLKEITLPDSLTKIDDWAFSGCENLEQVTIPDGVTEIGGRAFHACKKLKQITIPDGVTKINKEAFCGCRNLEQVTMPSGITVIDELAFAACENLKQINIPDSVTYIGYGAFSDCRNLEQVTMPSGITEIGDRAFAACENLKQINIPDSVTTIGYEAFSDNLEKIAYKGYVIKREQMHFAEALSDGLDTLKCLNILARSREILNDDVLSPILITKLCQAEHNGALEQTAAKIQKDFNTIGFYEISSKVDIDAREKLVELFKNNTASRGVVPKIIDALTIASTTLHIAPETIVHAFEDKKFRDAIIAMRSCHKNNHFFDVEAVLFAMTFDVNEVKNVILDNPYKDYASVLLCDGYKNNNENCINAAKWIAAHPDTSKDIIDNIFKYKDYIDIAPEMTVPAIKTQFSKCEAQLETKRIEREYEGFKFEDCVCNLQKTEVELGKYKAYVMDGQDPRQVMLGYDTNCCQHLGGAGETAMMYGLVNPNAGFWVIEDKESGKILAQAECWETYTFEIKGIKLYHSSNSDFSKFSNDKINKYPGFWFTEDKEYAQEHGKYTYEVDVTFNNPINLDTETGQDILEKHFGGYSYGDDDIFSQEFREFMKQEGYDALIWEHHGSKTYVVLDEKQATIIPNRDNTLVFDNIEFADDRQIDQFAPIIAKWCEASPYQNILMGNGYNQMVNSEIRRTDGVEPPVCDEVLGIVIGDAMTHDELLDYICDDVYVSELNEDIKDSYLNELVERASEHGIQMDKSDFEDDTTLCEVRSRVSNTLDFDYRPDDNEIYTDADESCSLLKVNGQVEPYFVKAYEPFKEAEKQRCKEQQQKPEPRKEQSAYLKRTMAQIRRQLHERDMSRDDFDR